MPVSKVPNTQTSGFGTAATKNTGTSPGDVVEVQTGGKLPVLDGSSLTNVSGGKLLSIQTFTYPGGTYTKNPAASYVIVYVVGGGGGSGGIKFTYTINNGRGFGGAGGGCAIKKINNASLGATETVTVGNGGTAGTSTPTQGGKGGTSAFGAHCNATGGDGGYACTAPSNALIMTGAGNMDGGVGSGGDINLRGDPCPPATFGYAQTPASDGGRAAGPYGGPGGSTALTPDSAGIAAFADTGGGAAGPGGAAAGGLAGAAGGSGIVIVEEYA